MSTRDMTEAELAIFRAVYAASFVQYTDPRRRPTVDREAAVPMALSDAYAAVRFLERRASDSDEGAAEIARILGRPIPRKGAV